MQKRIDKIFFKDKSIPIDLFLDKILYHKKLGYKVKIHENNYDKWTYAIALDIDITKIKPIICVH